MKHLKLLIAAIAAMTSLSVSAQSWTGNDVATGDFYLYNIGQGKWLTAGNSWGTQASVHATAGFLSTLELSDGKYAIKNTEIRTNQKANGPGYLGTGAYMDAESAAYFTFTAAERTDGVKAYYIQNDGNNLSCSNGSTVVTFSSETGDNAQWVLVTKADRLAAMANATETAPVDATFLLKNPNFGRYCLNYDSWVWTFPGNENKNNAGDNTNFCVESYHVAFDFAQTVADAPTGYYQVRGQAFYRQDGSNNTDLPYFFINDQKVTFPAKTGSEGSMSAASTSFTAGNYTTAWSATTTYAGGDLKVGTHLDNNTALWCIWDNIQLQYLGPIDLSEYQQALADAVAAAEATEGTIPTAVYANIAAVVTEQNQTYSTGDEYSAAITAINSAVSTYATADIIAAYSRYNSVKAAAKAITSNLDTEDADNAADAATTVAGIDAAVVTLRAAFLAELPNVTIPTDGYIDVTAVMVDNASVRQNVEGWTVADVVRRQTWGTGPTTNFDETEFYQSNFRFYQTLALTPGTWEFGVTGFHRAGNHNTHFYAGEDQILIPGVANTVVNSMAEAQTYFDNGNGKVALKFLIETAGNVEIGINNQDTETDCWTIFRDFTLKYYGAPDYTVYENEWAALVAEANAAKGNYPNSNGSEFVNLEAAIADSPAGSNLKATYNEKITALQTALNAFNAAAPNYEALAREIIKAKALGMADEDVDKYAATNETTAATALANTKALMVDEYTYVSTNYSSAVNLGTWNASANAGTMTSQHWDGSGAGGSSYLEQGGGDLAYNLNSWTVTYDQNITLPAGNYVFKVAGRTAADHVTLTLNVTDVATNEVLGTVNDFPKGDTGLGINKAGATSFDPEDEAGFANNGNGRGWQWRYVKFSLTNPATVNVGVVAEADAQNRWMSFCNATVQTDDAANVALMEALVALNEAKNVAVPNQHSAGTGVFELDAAVDGPLYQACVDAKDAVNNFTLTNESTADGVNDLVTALNTAITKYNNNNVLVAPDANKHYNILVASYNHPMIYNAIAISLGDIEDKNPTGYKFVASSVPATYMAQAVKFTSAEDAEHPNRYYISFEAPEGVVYLTNGTLNGSNASWADSQIQGTTDVNKRMGFDIAPSENGFSIINTATNSTVSCQNGGNIYTEAGNADFIVNEASPAVVPVAIAAEKYATRIFPFVPTAIPGVEFYSCEATEDGTVLKLVEVYEPQANVPYILKNTNTDDVNVELSGWGLAANDTYTEGWLTGVYTETPVQEGCYVLQTLNGVQAFYAVSNADPVNAPAYRAYLTAPAAGANAFFFDFDTTGINAIDALTNGNAVIYDLQGRRVNKAEKGIYIVNGKKVVK